MSSSFSFTTGVLGSTSRSAPSGIWVALGEALHFGSLEFVTDQLGDLGLCDIVLSLEETASRS